MATTEADTAIRNEDTEWTESDRGDNEWSSSAITELNKENEQKEHDVLSHSSF